MPVLAAGPVAPALAAALLLGAPSPTAATADGGGPAPEQEAAPCPRPPGGPELPPDRAQLARRLSELLQDPALRRAHVGLAVQAAEGGEVLFQRHGEKRFIAASTAKLVTAAVALRRLGPAYRWETRLVAAGPVRGDTLTGDLWVVGGGDPGLTSEELRRWPDLLRRAGIRHAAGDVVADDRVFEGPPWGRGWSWEDLHAGWGAGVSALQLSPGALAAELVPGDSVGMPAVLRAAEGEPGPPVISRVRTGPPGSELRLWFRPRPEDGAVLLEGWVPAGNPVPLPLAPVHPTLHFLERLESFLGAAGITVGGRFRRASEGEAPPRAGRSIPISSEPLEEVLKDLLKESDNQMAEVLLRTLGLELRGRGTAEAGLEVVEETLAEWGIEPGAVSLADGSGLSRRTRLTPMALVRLLRRLRQLPVYEAFARALPVAGVDGTLARRLLHTAASENLRAKTGSLSGVRALAGYVTDADGETLVFALLLNGYDAPGEVATALEDLLVEQLALYHGPSYPGAACR